VSELYQLLTLLVLQHIGMLLVDNHTAETAALAVTDRQTLVIRKRLWQVFEYTNLSVHYT